MAVISLGKLSALGGGLASGYTLRDLFGGGKDSGPSKKINKEQLLSKKEATISADQTTYSPQVSRQMDYSPIIQLDSPQATATPKKEQSMDPTQKTTPTQYIPTRQSGTQETGEKDQGTGTNLSKMLLIGGALAGATLIGLEYVKGDN